MGTYHGYFDKSSQSSENEHVLQLISQVTPDILMVGFGMPLQEKWILENWDRIDAKLTIMVGGLYEYITGDLRRGPAWLINHYLEWLYRLFQSPRRYGKRYILDNTTFFYRILKQKFFPKKMNNVG